MAPYMAYSYSFDKYTVPVPMKNKLDNQTIYDIYCADNGSIWFATDMGISRYDGFRIRNFPLTSFENMDESFQVPYAVTSIVQGFGNLLFLQLLKGGIICFDLEKEVYIPISFNRLPDGVRILSFYVADEQNLYLGTSRGLYAGKMVRTEKEKWEGRISLSEEPLVKGSVSKLSGIGNDLIFACMDWSKAMVYNVNESKAEFLKLEEDSEITRIYQHDGYLWICSSSGIEIYDLKRKTLQPLQGTGMYQKQFSSTHITDIVCAGGREYFVATWNGVFLLKFNSKELSKGTCSIDYLEQQYAPGLGHKITKLFWHEKQQMLWIGTFGNGPFQMYYADNIYKSLIQTFDADISKIVEDVKGFIWILTNKGKLWRSTSNRLSVETVFQPWTKGLNSEEVYRMYKDGYAHLWLGDTHGNIICINPLTEEVSTFVLTPDGSTVFSEAIRQFCLDSRDRLWIITANELILFDYKTNKSKFVSAEYQGQKIKEIYSMAEDKEGNIWLGTNIGLKRMEVQGSTVSLFGDYERKAGLEVACAYYVYVNSYNQILASYSDKILRIDGREKEKVENVFTLLNGLSSSHIYCMVDDQNGNTWVGSNSGIVTIRNDRTLLYNYASFGYSNEVCHLRDGRLLWAGAFGLTFFDPLMVKSGQNKNELRLSELRVNDAIVPVGKKMNGQVILNMVPDLQRNFVFEPGNDDFTFYFSDFDYGIMQRQQVYRLLPDEKWVVGALEDGITFNRLPIGKYTLQVKLIYPDASESKVVEIPILVKTYWWNTFGAKLGYFLIISGILFGVYFYMERKGKRREMHRTREMGLMETLNLTKMKQEQKQEIDAMRDRLLVKFMEELRTPLSLIIAPLKEMSKELNLPAGIQPKLLVAYRNSLGMLNACDQLLAIYTQGSLSGKLNIAPYIVERLVEKVLFDVNELVRMNQIELRYDKRIKKDMEVWVDSKRISFVLHNMLSNAFNHIRFSGVVHLLLQEITRDGVRYCVITVGDNGRNRVRGVSKIIDDEQLSEDLSDAELGYDVMNQIVRLHHGAIGMKSLEGEGTEIVIELPVDRSVLKGDSNIIFVDPEPQDEPEMTVPIEKKSQEVPIPEETVIRDTENIPVQKDPVVVPVQRERKTLLIVEDHKDIRLYLKVLFGKEYDLFIATNGQEGVDMAIREQPDLILCDVMMPIKDGFDCCRELKDRLETCHIPFIMLTAKVEDDDIIHGLELGADDYMLKPFVPSILKAKVRNLINSRMNLKQMYTNLLMPPESEGAGTGDTEVKLEDPFITSVVKIIEENMCEADFSVKKLAAELNMSQPTLYRKVKQITDFTIVELIRGVRMRKAAVLLKQKIYAVQEVAEMVGYNDIPTFRKHFVDTFGTTPSTYSGSEDA